MTSPTFDATRRLTLPSAITCLVFGLQVTGWLFPPAVEAQLTGLEDLQGFETFSIMDIQSTETFSPLTGKTVATSGVVTLWAANGSGFWMQDPDGDGDAATSDGLFVHLGHEPRVQERPQVGDMVRVIGDVDEEPFSIAPPRTLLTDLLLLEVLTRGHTLPEPVPIVDLPDTDIADAISFWEPLEGMRVSLVNARVIAPTNRFGEFIVLTEADAVSGSGYFPDRDVMLMRSLGGDRVDYNPERITIDDTSLTELILVRPGDELVSLTGVVDCTFGNYKIQPESFEIKKQEPPSPPVSTRGGPLGDTRVTTYNLRNLFDTVDNPERFDENFDPGSGRHGTPSELELENRLEKHTLAVIRELEIPDVIVSQEFESTELFQRIGDRVNARAGTRYRAISLETSDRRGLEVGFLYDEARVELVDYFQLSGPAVEAAFGLRSVFRTREPLVGVFRFSPDSPPVTIIACKFKSKRLDPPLVSLNSRPIRPTEKQRKDQARVVREFVDSILEQDPDALVMLAGDFGDVQFAEPGEGDHALGILEGKEGDIPLRNLIDLEEESEAYTWLYQGNGQVLSHILVSPALFKRCVGADVLHFAADFPDHGLRNDPTTPLRASDRDPLEARFTFRSRQKNPAR